MSNFNPYGVKVERITDENGNYKEIYMIPKEEWERYREPSYSLKEFVKDTGIIAGMLGAVFCLVCGVASIAWYIEHGESPFGLRH